MDNPVDDNSITPLDTHHLRIAGAVVLAVMLTIIIIGVIRAVTP